MTKRVYKTALGKKLDLGALALKNEQTRAVGNMGVNARGDVIDSTGRVVQDSSKRVNQQYRNNTKK